MFRGRSLYLPGFYERNKNIISNTRESGEWVEENNVCRILKSLFHIIINLLFPSLSRLLWRKAIETTFEMETALRKLISEQLISEGKLRNNAANGIPDNCGLRAVVWRLLLRYLPLDTTQWPEFLLEQRGSYADHKVCHSVVHDTHISSHNARVFSFSSSRRHYFFGRRPICPTHRIAWSR